MPTIFVKPGNRTNYAICWTTSRRVLCTLINKYYIGALILVKVHYMPRKDMYKKGSTRTVQSWLPFLDARDDTETPFLLQQPPRLQLWATFEWNPILCSLPQTTKARPEIPLNPCCNPNKNSNGGALNPPSQLLKHLYWYSAPAFLSSKTWRQAPSFISNFSVPVSASSTLPVPRWMHRRLVYLKDHTVNSWPRLRAAIHS